MIKQNREIFKAMIFIMAFFIFQNTTFSQNQVLADSLKSVLEATDPSGSDRLKLLHRISIHSSIPDEAINYAEKVLHLSVELQDSLYQQSALLTLGTSYRLKGDLKKSLELLFQSAEIAHKYHFSRKIGEAYSEISNTYSLNEDYRNALIYNQKSYEILMQSDNPTPAMISMMNIGYNYFKLDSLDSATYCTQLAAQYFDSIKFEIAIAYAVGNQALIDAKRGETEISILKINESIETLKSFQDDYAISDFLNQLSKIFYDQGNYGQAIEIARRALEISTSGDFKEQMRDANYRLYQAYQSIKKFDQAIEYLQNYHAVRDSIVNMESVKKMASIRTQFEVGQKQIELDLLNAERRTERIIMIFIVVLSVILIVVTIVIFWFYRTKARINKILEAQKVRLVEQKNQLQSLNETKDKFFSIISHDLRGPVASFFGISRMIKFMVRQKATDQLLEVADDIDESVEKLSNLLDNLLSWATQQRGHIPYVPEKVNFSNLSQDLVKTFRNMAFAKKINLTAEVDENIELWSDRNTTMTIFRNLINNALKFTPEEGEVKILAERTGEGFLLKVSDSGVGMSAEKLENIWKLQDKKSTYGTSGEKGLGLGLQLVHEFVLLNKGEISVESEEGKGTTFIVSLPVFTQEVVEA